MANLPIELSNLSTGLAQAGHRISSGTSEFPFIKLDKGGDWVFGINAIEVTDGLWAINPQSFIEGFVAWGDGELLGEEMAPMANNSPIAASSLPEMAGAKYGWQKQVGLHMVAVAGEFTGQQVIYKTNSKGGVKAVREIVAEVVDQINGGDGDYVPVVELQSDSYMHRAYGKTIFPIFKVDHWTDMNATAIDGHEDETPPEKAPAKRRRIAG
jgi:hypothetical protein|tara:strand:+ start:266 stop:901 length:636 start_codon:yes stop_codon:yes gene_type:complete